MTDPATNEHVDVQSDHYKVVREIGAAATVLLKNVAGALPLRAPKSVAIIGMPPRLAATESPQKLTHAPRPQATTPARPSAARTATPTAAATTARSRWAGARARRSSRT